MGLRPTVSFMVPPRCRLLSRRDQLGVVDRRRVDARSTGSSRTTTTGTAAASRTPLTVEPNSPDARRHGHASRGRGGHRRAPRRADRPPGRLPRAPSSTATPHRSPGRLDGALERRTLRRSGPCPARRRRDRRRPDQLCTTTSGTWWRSASSAAQCNARCAAGDPSMPTTMRSGPPRLAGPRTTTTGHGLRCTRWRGVLPSQNAGSTRMTARPDDHQVVRPDVLQEHHVDRARGELAW